MDMLNKLKSTVSTTVSQLSGVLPGNPVTREYEVGKHIASAGPDLLWKVYNGYKKSTKQEAAIFVLEKKLLDKYPKKDKDMIIDVFRRGVAQLTRLRHPQILTVQHSLEESRESLAFATEPVFASLANILGNHENIPLPVPAQLREYNLFEVEIKYGLQQLTEGLIFLHNDVKLLHGNLCPESIVVNQQGAWKIFGFDFCSTSQNSGDSKSWPVREPDPDTPPVAQANLDYLAPEIGRGKRYGGNINSISVGPPADMYSLGCLVASLYQKGHSPWRMDGDVDRFYRHASSNAVLQRLEGIPAELSDQVRSLTLPTPEQRPDAHTFVKIHFFDDVGVKTLNYLDSLFQWDNLQKSQFFKGLPQILGRLPHRVCLYRIMPCLAKEFVNPSMVPFILPCALLIAQEATKENYVSHILPYLKPVMKIQEPVQVLLIFMQRMELLLQKTPADDVKTDVLPMVYRALEAEAAPQIQELCLTIIPSFASLIDYPAMKNALLPRIKKLCLLPNSQLSVRVNCLLCIGKLLDNVDKWLVLDDVLPMLPIIPSKDPAVIMGILGVYKTALEHQRLGIPKEVIATQVVPFLFPLTVEPGLSLQQFRALMAILRDMMQRVEDEQKAKLENVAALNEEHRSALSLTLASPTTADPPPAQQQQQQKATTAKADAAIESFLSQLSTSSSATDLGKQTMTPSNGSVQMSSSRIDSAANKTPGPVLLTPTTTPASSSLSPSSSTWNTSHQAPPRADPVSSMMQSNLSQMTRPSTTAWTMSQPLQQPANASMGWSPMMAGPQPTPFPPQLTHFSPMMASAAVPLLPRGQLTPSSAPVRALARADIDDLLS